MNPFFSTPERVQALARSASVWPGTPFCHNGAVPGKDGGASCHRLAVAILDGAGFVIDKNHLPRARVTYARQHTGGLMLPWFRARGSIFAEMPLEVSAILPGDVLVANIGEMCENHCGVALPESLFIHTLKATGAHLTAFGDPFLKTHLVGIFRPLEQ